MADVNKPSTKPGIFGTFENAGKRRQRNLNKELGDNLNPRKLGSKHKQKRNPAANTGG